MPASNQEASQVADALLRLSVAMEQMQASYAATQRVNRRVRVALLVVLIVFGAVAYQAFSPLAEVLALAPRLIEQLGPPAMEAEAAALKRKELLAGLAPEQRAGFEQFEVEHQFLNEYLSAYPDFKPGIMISLFLSQMADSVKVMPDMYEAVRSMEREIGTMNIKVNALPVLATDVQAMNNKMSALPVLANEVQGMNVKMSVMAAGMDSTMGRTGRMMPWSW